MAVEQYEPSGSSRRFRASIHVLPSSFEIATVKGVRLPPLSCVALNSAGTEEWSFHAASRSPVEGMRLIEAGERGDRSGDACASLQVFPPSCEYEKYWLPSVVRINIRIRLSFNSTTPGS